MFYWLTAETAPKISKALDAIRDVYSDNIFARDMLIALGKNQTFLTDLRFRESFDSLARTEREQSLIWRLHGLAWAATHALHVPGDFVECGVFHGFSSAVLCKYLNFADVPKTFYLYDTFSGLPEATSTAFEREHWNPAYQIHDPDELLAQVRKTFAPYPNVRIIQGIIPDSFQQAAPDRIAYLHIDLNSAQAEVLALEQLFDRVSPGGLIVFDDFGWIGNRAQTMAELSFLNQRGHSILELPTGQGLVIKLAAD